jgi:hypothetical protein
MIKGRAHVIVDTLNASSTTSHQLRYIFRKTLVHQLSKFSGWP